MRHRTIWLLGAGLVCLSAHAERNCGPTAPAIEKSLCARPDLAQLDAELNAVYRAALARSDAAAILRAEQREWLSKVRDTCDTYDCIKQVYEQQIIRWKTVPMAADLQKQFGGKYVRMFNGRRDSNDSSIDVKAAPGARLAVSGKAVRVFDIHGDIPDATARGFASHRQTWSFVGEGGCRFLMAFQVPRLVITDDNESCGGHGVTFNGTYQKIKDATN